MISLRKKLKNSRRDLSSRRIKVKNHIKKIEVERIIEINQILISLRKIKKQVLNIDNLKVLRKIDKIEFQENQNLMTREYLSLKKWIKMGHLQKRKVS